MGHLLKFMLFAYIVYICSCAAPEPEFKLEIPEECKKLGYCKKIRNYPQDLVDELMKTIKTKLMNWNTEENKGFVHRGGDEYVTRKVCEANEWTLIPDALQDMNNTWWLVLQNRGNNKTQTFGVETCDNRRGSCNSIQFYEQYVDSSQCSQMYIYRLVTVMEGNYAVGKLLKIPNCCTCMLTLKQ